MIDTTVTLADCGCGYTNRLTLAFCPLHAVAPRMLQALKAVRDAADWGQLAGDPRPIREVISAIDAAEAS